MEITGKTGLLGVLGSPIEHSLSPAMHNLALKLLDLDYAYLAFDVKESELEKALEGLKILGFRGCNLTMPLKKKAVELCDRISEVSQISGSVNTIINENGTLIGDTTDGTGFFWAMKESGHNLIGKKITFMGAGGAIVSIVTQGAFDGVGEITIFNRVGPSYDRMEEIITKLQEKTSCKLQLLTLDDDERLRAVIQESDLLVNGTSLGMSPNEESSILGDSTYFREDLVVVDVIYNPRETKFMRLAKEAGATAYNGLDMLLYQGAKSFELWTGKRMPIARIKEEVFDKAR